MTEYALRMLPKAASSGPGLRPGLDNQGRLQWQVEARDDDPKLIVRGEAASDLHFIDLISLPPVVTDPTPGDGFNTYIFVDSESSFSVQRRFARIRFVIGP